jgi:UDP-glucose 4-epimerase
MNILVTGGAGFIGTHLIEQLLKLNHTINCLDNLSTGTEKNVKRYEGNKNFKFIYGQVENETLLRPLVESSDIIYHLAATVGVKNVLKDSIQTIENNIEGTQSILKLSHEYKKRVFIFSTSEVYGKRNNIPFREDDDLILGPSSVLRWSYATSKLIDEHLGMAYYEQHRLPVTVIRLFNTIGRGQLGHYGMVVPKFFECAMSGKPIVVFGKGDQSRCFTDVRDVVAALIELSVEPKSYGQVINIGSAEKIRTMVKSDSTISHIDYQSAYGGQFEDMQRRVPCAEKLYNLTGYRMKYNLDDTLSWIHAGYVEEAQSLDDVIRQVDIGLPGAGL